MSVEQKATAAPECVKAKSNQQVTIIRHCKTERIGNIRWKLFYQLFHNAKREGI